MNPRWEIGTLFFGRSSALAFRRSVFGLGCCFAVVEVCEREEVELAVLLAAVCGEADVLASLEHGFEFVFWYASVATVEGLDDVDGEGAFDVFAEVKAFKCIAGALGSHDVEWFLFVAIRLGEAFAVAGEVDFHGVDIEAVLEDLFEDGGAFAA